MSIEAYRKKRHELDLLKNELEKMEKSDSVKKEMSFVTEIHKVLKKYKRTVADLAMAFPEAEASSKAKPAAVKSAASAAPKKAKPAASKKKRARKSPAVRTFKHPQTGETLKVKRTNNKTLKEWASTLSVSIESMEVK